MPDNQVLIILLSSLIGTYFLFINNRKYIPMIKLEPLKFSGYVIVWSIIAIISAFIDNFFLFVGLLIVVVVIDGVVIGIDKGLFRKLTPDEQGHIVIVGISLFLVSVVWWFFSRSYLAVIGILSSILLSVRSTTPDNSYV